MNFIFQAQKMPVLRLELSSVLMKGRLGIMMNSIAEHKVNYGVIELAPDGNIQHVTKEVDELLLDRRNEHSKNLFQ